MSAINTALFHMAQQSMRADAPAKGLPKLTACCNCKGTESIEISYELLRRAWIVWCGCGQDSGERRTLRAALINWNKENKP